MAWSCGGGSNTELVKNLCKAGLISIPAVKEAFLQTDRGLFSPRLPYMDSPQVIGLGATISAPHMHASAVEYLHPKLVGGARDKGKLRVLDVGSGSGYLCQVMSLMAGPGSIVVGVEHIQELVDQGRTNVEKSKTGRDLLAAGRLKFVLADGRKGWKEPDETPEQAGWDVIHVGAAAQGWPKALLDQLRPGGRIFIPVEEPQLRWQDVWVVDKDEWGKVNRKRLYSVRYIPLTDPEKQLET